MGRLEQEGSQAPEVGSKEWFQTMDPRNILHRTMVTDIIHRGAITVLGSPLQEAAKQYFSLNTFMRQVNSDPYRRDPVQTTEAPAMISVVKVAELGEDSQLAYISAALYVFAIVKAIDRIKTSVSDQYSIDHIQSIQDAKSILRGCVDALDEFGQLQLSSEERQLGDRLACFIDMSGLQRGNMLQGIRRKGWGDRTTETLDIYYQQKTRAIKSALTH